MLLRLSSSVVEQGTHKPKVAGSNPAWAIEKITFSALFSKDSNESLLFDLGVFRSVWEKIGVWEGEISDRMSPSNRCERLNGLVKKRMGIVIVLHAQLNIQAVALWLS